MDLEVRQGHAESLPRDHQDSEPVGWVSGHTRIGPVLHVKVVCCLDQYGIEIQVPSTSRDGSNSWTVISRDPHRYADESWHDRDNSPEKDQDEPPQDVEIVSSKSVERSHAITSSIVSSVEAANTIESDELPF